MGIHGAVFAIVHTALLLTVSFFVLLAIRKVDTQPLKVFGYAVTVLLWIAAALIFGKGFTDQPMMPRMDMGDKMRQPVCMGDKMPRPPVCMGDKMPRPPMGEESEQPQPPKEVSAK